MYLMGALRIAMWSGPRNISTAMMRAWENRPDTSVWDEPLYGHFLAHTGMDHPMRREILETCETDWRKTVQDLTGPIPGAKAIQFQKHMTQHMLEHIDRGWMAAVTNCFLIRKPEQVIASYAAKRDQLTAADLGFDRQAELFEYVCQKTGSVPPVLDARDVLTDPEGLLSKFCSVLDVEFSPTMLSWRTGMRDSDGVWARHWYHAVEQSTGFAPYRENEIELSDEHRAIAEAAQTSYAKLYRHRLVAD